ncbi:right-handed parallel beta-helix repeat-containing protein [Rhodopirellula sp. SWK7]|uniref:right-handed parallel beta-helix repeat-containing protein n=1 Tax=Rhodopirellula sp. SWK7 TaxID=595460 RepID=UPI001360B65B|nr:right-handed parallel beta-helix repeat-containing protein [Rhodopirellula sp. SWK7]
MDELTQDIGATDSLVLPAMASNQLAESHLTADQFIGGHHEPFLPNFAHSAFAGSTTVVSDRDGEFGTIFDGIAPNETAIIRGKVTIMGDHHLRSIVVADGGELTFSRILDTNLTLRHLQVHQGGRLDIGTVESPIEVASVAIIFEDYVVDRELDPGWHGGGLIVQGSITVHGRNLDNPITYASSSLFAGSNSFEAASYVGDWLPNDEILVPDTRQFRIVDLSSSAPNDEVIRLHEVGGEQLSLQTPLAHDHPAAAADLTAPLANLKRNIVLRSQNPEGNRGHVMLIGGAAVDIRFAEFRDLGRTTNQPLDETVYDAHGNVTHIGDNPPGRYAIHLHHLFGPPSMNEGAPQYVIAGNAIYNTSTLADGSSPKWGLVIHDSHYGQISDNIVHRFDGAGIVTEGGSETGNTIQDNLVSRTGGTGARGKITDGREGSGFWFRRAGNRIDGNVAINSKKAGFAIYGSDNHNAPSLLVPTHPGVDVHATQHSSHEARSINPAQVALVHPETMTMESFTNNTSIGGSAGLEFWYYGFSNYYNASTKPIERTTVDSFTAWHTASVGVVAFQINAVDFDDTRIVGDPTKVDRYNSPTGFHFENTEAIRVNDAVVSGMKVGVLAPVRTARLLDIQTDDGVAFDSPPFLIEGGSLANQINIRVATPRQDSFRKFAPRQVLVNSVRFSSMPGKPSVNIQMSYQPGRFSNLVQEDIVQVRNYDQRGHDFRVYYTQQQPNFVVPETGSFAYLGRDTPLGASNPGLTNLELWRRDGIAIGGAIAPGDENHYARFVLPEIDGLAFPQIMDQHPPGPIRVDPDGGVVGDRIVATGRLELHGDYMADAAVEIEHEGVSLGVAETDSNGNWRLSVFLEPGQHSFRVRGIGSTTATFWSEVQYVSVRPNPPILQSIEASVDVPLDGQGNGMSSHIFVATVQVSDHDTGDAFIYRVEASSGGTVPVTVQNDGRLFVLPDVARQWSGRNFEGTLLVTDTAGLTTAASINVHFSKPPAAQTVPLVPYFMLHTLSASEVPFITEQQLATLTSYRFSQWEPESRAALTDDQIKLLPVFRNGLLKRLQPTQLLALTSDQIRSVRPDNLRYLQESQIPIVLPRQISEIASSYALSLIPKQLRDRFTLRQVESLAVENGGLVRHLNIAQRAWLTATQVGSLPTSDLQHLILANTPSITNRQLSLITTRYEFTRMNVDVRFALTRHQVEAIALSPMELVRLVNPDHLAD